jgi:hypothetical protein
MESFSHDALSISIISCRCRKKEMEGAEGGHRNSREQISIARGRVLTTDQATRRKAEGGIRSTMMQR